MSTNYLALRSSAAPTLTVSTLLGSTISTRSISFQSTTISLGQSTNQSYTNFSGGSFTTGWASTLTGATSIKKVVLSPNGSVQTILQNSGSTMSTVITSLNSGITWTGSTMRGLPTSGALPYQTYGSTINAMPVPSITAITAAPSGTNQLAIASNELVYASANSGATFSPTGLGQNNNPFIYLPFDGSVTDIIGNSAVTATGSMAYVAGKVGTNALNLVNTAGIFSNTANNYVRCTIPSGMTSFTISGWFNSQTTVSTGYPTILTMYSLGFLLYLNPGTTIQLVLNYPTGSGNGQANIQTSCGIAMNTWYSFTIVYQIGTISLYLNGALVGTGSSTGLGTFTGSTLGLGCYDSNTNQPFSGYIDDFRLYNYAVTNPSGAALINPLVGPIMPFVYLPFDGSTTTDVMGNSTVTATGSPTFVVGQVGSNAIYFANAGTGSNPTQYLTAPISGLGNAITFSWWFQALILPTSTQSVIWTMNAVTSGDAVVQFNINTAGTIGFQIYNGSIWQGVYSTSAISLNTWYNVVCIYQAGTTCSLYINGALTTMTLSGSISPAIASYTLGGANRSPATPTYGFRGYVDDFRIYTGAFTPSQLSPVLYSPSHAIGSPNIYLPFENGSVLDTMGYSAVSARGTMNFVPGVVGTSALNLVNPVSGNPNNYVYASWAGSSSFTVSGWVNVQGFSGYSIIFSAYNRGIQIYTNYGTNTISAVVPSGSSTTYLSFNSSSPAVVNTWYSFTLIFQTNGLCSFYVNNQLAGSGTNSGGFGSFTNSGVICLGGYDNATASGSNAFSGYIDDFKIYNSAVPFNALGPMNYTQAAISNSGAYQVVAAANGGVYTSANSGSTWSQAVTSPAVASAVNTVGGQVITPQLTGLVTNTWTQNGVNWVVSTSTALTSYFPHRLFDNTQNNSWANSVANYTSSTNTSGQTTVIQGVGSTTGDWAQIQSSVPLVMTSYQFGSGGGTNQLPKTYYIVGSNDGSTWYLIQYGAGGAVTTTAPYTIVPGTITVNSTSTQTFGSSTITTTAYSTSTNAYTYFRLIGLSVYYPSGNAYLEIGEWYINFATPATPLYVAPSTALIANQSLNAITVMPQQTGLVSNTWTINGISWVASASSSLGALYPYGAFNNYVGSAGTYSWGSIDNVYSGTTPFAYTGAVSTTIQGIGATVGEWLQIQTSVPLVMQTYSYTCGGFLNIPKKYWIVGSNDGSTWYPIQYADMTTNPFTANFQVASTYITVNQSGTQTIIGAQTGSGSFITYPTTTNAYTYFRILATNVFGTGAIFELGEWYINFTAYTPALLQSLTMSPSGQYMALTGAGATAPNLTGLAANTWVQNGVAWTASASSVNTGAGGQIYYAFDKRPADRWVPNSGSVYTNTGNTSGVYTTVLGGIGSVQGDWIQLQSSTPLIMNSYQFATGYILTAARIPRILYIVGSNDGSSWYPIQSAIGTGNPTMSSLYLLPGSILVNSDSTQVYGAGTLATTTYPTTSNAYFYFRLITVAMYTSAADTLDIGEWYINFQSGPTFYSTDYGSSWTTALSAATVPNANVLATSGNGQYSLQGYGQTVIVVYNTFVGYSTGSSFTNSTFSPTLTASAGSVIAAALSATGQYMVVLTQGSSNNVYYSSNYGVSFTGITLGSTAMVSCDISADGSYITVANQTQVFTLNRNAQGFSVTIGSQAGLINQGQNAIAIGDKAGQINQSANSIILNGSGAAVNAYVPGFFVAPVASAGSSVSSSFAVLGYGTDSQVVQSSSLFIGANGNMGIGTTNPNAPLQFPNVIASRKIVMWETGNNDHQYYGLGINPFMLRYQVDGTSSNHVFYTGTSATTSNELMRITGTGNVGIGTTAPDAKCHVEGALGVYSTTNDIMGLFSPNYGSYLHIGSWNRQGNTSKDIVMNLYGGRVGIGITNPQATLHVQGGTLVTNPTVYNSAVGGWFIIGYWDCAGAQNAGAHLKLRIMGCNGYDNTGGTDNQMGGETTIYLNNLNNLNTTTNANVDGFWKHEGGQIPITQVKAVQGGSRYQYFIYASVQSYTQHSITAETTQGTIWTSQMTSTSDPGANSLTVRVLTLSTSAVGATVGIGATNPGSGISVAIPNAKLTILGGAPGQENGIARISIGGDSYHYAAIEGKHIGSGSTTLSFMTCTDYSVNSGNPQTRMFIAAGGNVGIGITTPVARLDVFGSAVTSNIEMFRCVLSNGNQILSVFATANTTNGGWNGFDTVLRVTRDVGTSRSINAAGSINANGADYAEYMTKDSDFSAQKGDILGVLPSGKLTNQYDDAIHFLLKSTNPCMVGGDVWGTEAVVGEKPKEPEKEATEEEKEAHAAALAAWKARLEAERKKVDRMAFAGQVPVNILGATPGNYIIPLRNADGSIGVAAVSQADMSFSQYQRAVGRVISILEDGRANVIVKAV